MLQLAAGAPFQPLHPLRYWGYQWWSGLGSDLAYIAMVVSALIVAWRVYRNLHKHFECHSESCTRLGIHRVSGTHYRTCWTHHPVLSQHPLRQVPQDVIVAAHRLANLPNGQEHQ